MSGDNRAHGVTPSLSRDYATRVAAAQAAFVLPYLRAGMRLLDVGCGPASISVGLAAAVAPGALTGIDHDAPHIEAAKALASERGVDNARFQIGDALSLPFDDGSFDAAFENNVFTHLADKSVRAAREVHRVLKPGGLFAARDVDTDAVMWGHRTEAIAELDRLFTAWLKSRGSDTTVGARLSAILREAGFVRTEKSVSADTKGTPEAVRSHADITLSLLDGPFGKAIVENAWGDLALVDRLKDGIREWAAHPDAFFANVHVEVVGFKE